MNLLRISFLILVIPSVVFAQTKPKITVDAPKTVDREEYIIQLTLTVENADELPPKIKLNHTWTILEDGNPRKRINMFEGGKQVIVPTGKTNVIEYHVMTTYDYDVKKPLKVTDKDGKLIEDAKVFIGDAKTPSKEVIIATKTASSDEVSGKIEVQGGSPSPNPPPPPPPIPSPTFPEGEFGLAKANYDIAMKEVPDSDRSKASALADAFEKVAKRIATSQSKLAAGVSLTNNDLKLDMDSIIKESRQENATALGSSATAWEGWNSGFGDKIYELFTQNRLTTPAQFKTAFIETALGLRQVK